MASRQPAPAASSAAAAASVASSAAPAAAASSAAVSNAASQVASIARAGGASSSSAAASVASSSAARPASSAAASSAAPAASSTASSAVASSSAASSAAAAASSSASSISSSSASSSRSTSKSSTNTLASSSSNNNPSSSSSLSTGAIIGIVVGVIGGLAFLALLWRYCKRRKENKLPPAPLPPPRDPTSMRQRKQPIDNSSMNRASSYSTLPAMAYASHSQSHSRQPSLSDFSHSHGGHGGIQPKSSMNSLNNIHEHSSPSELEAGFAFGGLQRPSPLGTPSEASASSSSRGTSPYPLPPTDFMPAGQHTRNSSYASASGPAPSGFRERPEWRGSISSLSSASYGVTHTGKLVSVQMPKRLGAQPPMPMPDRVPSGIARWRDDLQAPSMAQHHRTPSNLSLSMHSPAVSASTSGEDPSNSSDGSHASGSERAIRRER